MKKILFIVGLVVAAALFSCQSSPESKLIGTWKVVEVETDFDEDFARPQMLKQMVETQKNTFFKILNDSAMVIISSGNTFEANWKLNLENQMITYTFSDSDDFSVPFDLGVYTEKQIVAESKMSMGKMVIYFEKE